MSWRRSLASGHTVVAAALLLAQVATCTSAKLAPASSQSSQPPLLTAVAPAAGIASQPSSAGPYQRQQGTPSVQSPEQSPQHGLASGKQRASAKLSSSSLSRAPALPPQQSAQGIYVSQQSPAPLPPPMLPLSGEASHGTTIILIAVFISIVFMGSIGACCVSLLWMARIEHRQGRLWLGFTRTTSPSGSLYTYGSKEVGDPKVPLRDPPLCTIVIQPDGMHGFAVCYQETNNEAGSSR